VIEYVGVEGVEKSKWAIGRGEQRMTLPEGIVEVKKRFHCSRIKHKKESSRSLDRGQPIR